jgi:hypothetical protein
VNFQILIDKKTKRTEFIYIRVARDAEGAEVEPLRRSNTPQSLPYNTDTSEDLLFQDNLNPGFF